MNQGRNGPFTVSAALGWRELLVIVKLVERRITRKQRQISDGHRVRTSCC